MDAETGKEAVTAANAIADFAMAAVASPVEIWAIAARHRRYFERIQRPVDRGTRQMLIGNAIEKGSTIYVYDEWGRTLFTRRAAGQRMVYKATWGQR